MTGCECSQACSFYNNMKNDIPNTYWYVRAKYCDGNFHACDRFKISQTIGIENVPDALPPLSFRGMRCFTGR